MTMNEFMQQESYDPNRLFAYLTHFLQLKNDIALSRTLRVSHALLVAIREQRLTITGAILLQMQEVSQLSIVELRTLMGDRRHTCRMPRLLSYSSVPY